MKNYEVAIYTDLLEVIIYVVKDCVNEENACRRAFSQWYHGYGIGNVRDIVVTAL